DSMVLKINHDNSGKVTGVVYADKTGTLQEQKARVVCVAGNSVETPRLLLNSQSAKFPNGLANSSGQVGRNYMRHMTGTVYAIMPIPVRHFKDHANDVAMRNHAYKAGTAVYQSLGATQVFELPPFPSTHNMGTCRQSEKAQDGVCNKYGQTHDVANLFISDGSQFTTGGAENPTLTIVALAI